MEAFLLYEGNEYLSRKSLVLMGVFTSEVALHEAAETLIRETTKKNYRHEEYPDPYDLQELSEDLLEDYIEEEMDQLFNCGQTHGSYTRYLIKCCELNKLEEI